MNLKDHKWAMHAQSDVEFILQKIGHNTNSIVDFGCGKGRHSLLLASKGYQVTGVDFIQSFVSEASNSAMERNLNNCTFMHADCRFVEFQQVFDVGLCLYDVIGLFPQTQENKKILTNLAKAVKPNGIIVFFCYEHAFNCLKGNLQGNLTCAR